MAVEIADYNCYRTYLSDFVKAKKSLRAGFSYRQVAGAVGFGSPNYLQQVIQGKKNLSEATADRLAEALKLTSQEHLYFVAMVQKDNAATNSEREKTERHLMAMKGKLLSKPLPENHRAIIEDWYHLLVRELVFLKDFEPSGKYISAKLNHLISEAEAEHSLALLLNTGYVQKQQNTYKVQDPIIDTGLDTFTHKAMQVMHAKLLKTWSERISELGSRTQELGVLNIPINQEHISELQLKVRQFQDEIIGWAENLQKSVKPDSIVQLGTYLMSYGEKP